jgi:hypothetical protein
MKLLQVNYRRKHGQGNKDQAEYLLAAAERIAEVPGLQWKIWIYDDENQRAGGIYLFDSEEHARAFGDRIPDSLNKLPGVGDIDRRYFDVDERLSEITRGPVGAAQEV